MTECHVGQEGAALLKLGFAFMSSGLMTMGVAYAVRITLLRKVGFEATGWYQSAWTLGGLYVGFILQAMGADFYPRLTASANDNEQCNRLVNEQARVGLLLAGPGVLATLTGAPLVMSIFYSAKFAAGLGGLRWICLGAGLRVITWPMVFIVLAKGRQDILFLTDVAWTTVNLCLSWLCVSTLGLNGAGVAFFGAYIFHGLLVYPVVSRLSGFRWSLETKRTGLMFFSMVVVVFGGFYVLPLAAAGGIGATAASG